MTNMIRHMKTLHSEIINESAKIIKNESFPKSEMFKNKSHSMHYNLESIVPDGYDYRVIEYTSLGEEQFIAKFDINSFGVDNINSWLLAIREKSKITFLATSVRNSKTPEIIYKKRFRCHHNTRPKIGSTPSQKHYNCKATLGLKIIKDLRNDEVGLKNNLQTKAVILLKHTHNHEILRAEVLKHRIPSDEVKSKILKLFEEGKTPSKALFTFKSQLRVEKGNNYYVSAGDRGELPDPQWVYNLYYKMFKKTFGVAHGNDMTSFVNSFQTNVRTHASLNSAMQTFGKYSGLNPNSKKPKLMGTKKIGVQPTTRARRKTEIGGRRNLAAGRNPKWKRTTEHGYVQKIPPRAQIKRKPFDPSQLPSKLLKTPHSLSYCVENNKLLGATHSAK